MPNYSNQGSDVLNAACIHHSMTDAWLLPPHPDDVNTGTPPRGVGLTRVSPLTGAGSRIDRIYISAPSSSLLSATQLLPQPSLTDHDAIITTFQPPRRPRRSPQADWRLNTSFLKDEYFLASIRYGWEAANEANVNNLNTLELWISFKKQIKRMSVSYAIARAKEKRQAVASIQSQLQSEETSPVERTALREQLTALNSASLDLSQTSSAVLQLTTGDRPTKSFFRKVGQSSKTNAKISSLSRSNGQVLTSDSGIQEELCAFWGDVFGENLPDQDVLDQQQVDSSTASLNRIHRRLPASAQQTLTQPYDMDELEAAKKRLQLGKHPGPDGLPAEVYLACWDFLAPIVLQMAHSIQAGDALPADLVSANLALLPKTDLPSPSSGQFRPISLLNTDYKLVAAMLAARMCPLLPQLVDELQTGFVPGRHIWENNSFNVTLSSIARRPTPPCIWLSWILRRPLIG